VGEVARGLNGLGVQAGDRVVLALPNGIPFFCAVIACIGAGAMAVPAPVPGVARSAAFLERIKGILADCGPALVITETAAREPIAQITEGRCPAVSYQSVRDAGAGAGQAPPLEPESSVALLQYTSGSTGRPRGLVVTHESLAAACAQAAQAYAERADDVGVTWVPLYHDLGLNTGVMRPLFSGYPSVLLRPEEFARQPVTWLEAMDACRGTVSSGPNFAYDLCARKVEPERAAELDLSSWRVARNGGEVVRAETVDRFGAHFASAGFPAQAMCPTYGLAEATLTVTTCTPDVRPRRLHVLRSDFQRGVVTPVDGPAGPGLPAVPLLSSGVPLPGTSVRAGEGDSRVGPISIRGPQLAAGHWGDTGVSRDRKHTGDGWYDTGDLGFVYDGHLFIVGRADDTIVYHGSNFYLSDIVAACAKITLLRPGRLAPFVVQNEDNGSDEVCVVAELRPGEQPDAGTLARLAVQTKQCLASALELYVSRVAFVAPGALPVTTSGKVRASEVKRRFASGHLPVLA
jgi:acyl-CoA synthetase (AMP-forming)/AMP-acid ligase II